eukprot:SAG22_NODE_18888_length_280_cov_0.856354_1_plen_29_part_10
MIRIYSYRYSVRMNGAVSNYSIVDLQLHV